MKIMSLYNNIEISSTIEALIVRLNSICELGLMIQDY